MYMVNNALYMSGPTRIRKAVTLVKQTLYVSRTCKTSSGLIAALHVVSYFMKPKKGIYHNYCTGHRIQILNFLVNSSMDLLLATPYT